MSIMFISDLHLCEDQPHIADLFKKFLKQATKDAKTLYILGDLFETWIGDDDLSPFNRAIMGAFKQATDAGLPIFLMHGNRDFLMGKRFLKLTGCKLLPDEHVISPLNTPLLLMHGDTLCTEDKAYLRFRKRARNPLFQRFFLWKSLEKRRAIASDYRAKSAAHLRTVPDYIMDVTQQAVEKTMHHHQVQHLIHGHTHRQAIHEFQLNKKPATRTVLGAWHNDGNALVCDEHSGQREFIIIK